MIECLTLKEIVFRSMLAISACLSFCRAVKSWLCKQNKIYQKSSEFIFKNFENGKSFVPGGDFAAGLKVLLVSVPLVIYHP